jgi:hypothetical protein
VDFGSTASRPPACLSSRSFPLLPPATCLSVVFCNLSCWPGLSLTARRIEYISSVSLSVVCPTSSTSFVSRAKTRAPYFLAAVCVNRERSTLLKHLSYFHRCTTKAEDKAIHIKYSILYQTNPGPAYSSSSIQSLSRHE